MPELPEVESVVRTLRDGRPSLTGLRILSARIIWDGVISGCCADDFKALLKGSRIEGISRHGKYLFFKLERERSALCYLIIHLRMTGRLLLVPKGDAPGRHTRMSLLLERDLEMRFEDPRKFGRAWLVRDVSDVTGRLGPDALAIEFEQFSARLAESRRKLKPLLLDQSVLAGIGNIYADEILFRAGLHPDSISGNLSGIEVRRLYDAVISVLKEAVAADGANIDGVFKSGHFAVSVYGRQGRPCPRCGEPILKFRSGQRGTHACPQCQILR